MCLTFFNSWLKHCLQLHNTMHFLEMAFVGWETENWDKGGEKHTDKIIQQLGSFEWDQSVK